MPNILYRYFLEPLTSFLNIWDEKKISKKNEIFMGSTSGSWKMTQFDTWPTGTTCTFREFFQFDRSREVELYRISQTLFHEIHQVKRKVFRSRTKKCTFCPQKVRFFSKKQVPIFVLVRFFLPTEAHSAFNQYWHKN